MVLLHLRELTSREGRELDEVQLTHEELGCLIACDRASTTRALHKMEQEGLIELGYRCIRLLPALDTLESLQANAQAKFHMPPKL